MSRWMTPTLTTTLIRPFLTLVFANARPLMFSRLRRSYSILYTQRVWLRLSLGRKSRATRQRVRMRSEVIPSLAECDPPIFTVEGWVLAGEMKTLVTLFSLSLLLLLLLFLLLLLLLQLHPAQVVQVSTKPHTALPLILIALSGSKAKLTCPLPNSKSNDFYC